MKRLATVALIGGLLSLASARAQDGPGRTAEVKPELRRGRELAQKYCAACHLFPEPELLTRTAWIHHIQPEMARWLGLERVDYEGMADGKILQEAKLFPPSPIISEEEWFAIWDYYRAAAPSQPLPQAARPGVGTGLKQFRVRKLNPHTGVPMTSLVKIDPEGKRLFVGDAIGNTLFTLNATGEVVERLRLPSGPVSLTLGDAGLYTTLIGRIFPSEAEEGAVLLRPGAGDKAGLRPLLENLRRPTDTVVAHLNTDRREDLVVCSYGNRLGRFSWFEGKEGGGFREHVLLDRPGAVRADVRDFNRDGRPDIIVMTAQSREGIYLFLNQGRNEFRMETLLEFPPSWGLASFELTDFNKDGRIDLLVANGDNGDFGLPLKNYHGVRLYLNDGKNHFPEAFFYPMHGAYKAVARDFDGDGDLDLAAIAFYPDFEQTDEGRDGALRRPLPRAAGDNNSPTTGVTPPRLNGAGTSQRDVPTPESFVYLENLGGMKFDASTCAESNAGRWMVMDAADLDGDDDDDIVLGSFVRGPTTMPVPQTLRDYWRTNGAVVLLLENVRH